MEKWRSKGRGTLKADVDFPKSHSRPISPVEKRKGKNWTFGNLFKRKTKESPISIVDTSTQTSPTVEPIDDAIYLTSIVPKQTQRLQQPIEQVEKISIINSTIGSQDSMTSPDVNNTSRMTSENQLSNKNGRKNRFKARIQAKREKYKGNSSSDEEYTSNISLLRIHSEDSIQSSPKCDSYNNKRTRGARTERYMKRLITNGDNKFAAEQNLMRPPSDYVPPPATGSPVGQLKPQAKHRTQHSYSPSNFTPFGSDYHLPTYRQKLIDSPTEFQSHNQSSTSPYNNATAPLRNCSDYRTTTETIQPPAPPPRSFKLRLFPTTMRYSLQHSDIENNPNEVFTYNRPHYNDLNCNSLDRMHTSSRKNFDYQYMNARNSLRSPFSPTSQNWPANAEKPIIPRVQESNLIIKPVNIIKDVDSHHHQHVNREDEEERKRHSKNLEEALEELETIYNSLRLSDEDLLDRAEQRSMEEYRDKIATSALDGSIKSTSDTCSSIEMAKEFGCYENDTSRLKDDMAYRRMHQNERAASLDNYGSITQISYLASSPCLSHRELDYHDKSSRRATPDLTRDDVAFRSISHANNTLKIIDPQPPFGIPLGPVTGAAESDYLHVEPNKDGQSYSRSLYIPKREPDIVTDDLAFRSLRKDANKDRAQSPGNMSFLPKTLFVPEVKNKKKHAVRSLSADLYGIINKADTKQTGWYKKYVKLNQPWRVSEIVESSTDNNRKKAFDYERLDINGNKPKINNCKVQVAVPQESRYDNDNNDGRRSRQSVELEIVDKEFTSSPTTTTKIEETSDKGIPTFTDQELSEYQELCRELESLIKKTSEKVKISDKADSRQNSLTEFVEWEEILGKANLNEEPLVTSSNERTVIRDHGNEPIKSLQVQLPSQAINIEEDKKILLVESENNVSDDTDHADDDDDDEDRGETNVSGEPIVPCVSISETTTTESASSSSGEKLKDGSSNNETTNGTGAKHETTQNSNAHDDDNDDDDDDENSAKTDDELNNDCHDEINIASMIEGEKIGDSWNVELSGGHSLKSIMNICFVTNCFTAYSVALWSLCLTLLIAIIVAL
uniref:Uncharacterized protein n=1 Tax=Bracon brevicornis TaxID=1563983 RepID=A0A6V7HLJ4_9HYME